MNERINALIDEKNALKAENNRLKKFDEMTTLSGVQAAGQGDRRYLRESTDGKWSNWYEVVPLVTVKDLNSDESNQDNGYLENDKIEKWTHIYKSRKCKIVDECDEINTVPIKTEDGFYHLVNKEALNKIISKEVKTPSEMYEMLFARKDTDDLNAVWDQFHRRYRVLGHD